MDQQHLGKGLIAQKKQKYSTLVSIANSEEHFKYYYYYYFHFGIRSIYTEYTIVNSWRFFWLGWELKGPTDSSACRFPPGLLGNLLGMIDWFRSRLFNYQQSSSPNSMRSWIDLFLYANSYLLHMRWEKGRPITTVAGKRKKLLGGAEGFR